MERRVIQVSGMSCTHCNEAVKRAVSRVPGVGFVDADYRENRVVVEYDPSSTDLEAIYRAIEEEGYQVVSR